MSLRTLTSKFLSNGIQNAPSLGKLLGGLNLVQMTDCNLRNTQVSKYFPERSSTSDRNLAKRNTVEPKSLN